MLHLAVGFSCAAACPFCAVVGRTLAQRRDAADAVVIAEAEGRASPDVNGLLTQRFRVRGPLRGDAATSDEVVSRVGSEVRGTAVLFLEGGRWEAIEADEPLIAHVAATPAANGPAAARLRWFAPRLEHPEPAIAEDAFAEFGLAPFEAVREAVDSLDAEKLRTWVDAKGGDQRRLGFYGLALGLTAARAVGQDRRTSIDALHAAILAPADDFRAGFDGLLAGVLVAEGEEGLAFFESRGLFAKGARPVDQRHLLSALRFGWESLAESIPRPRIAAVTARLLASPVVAADAAVDLARYGAWDHADEVAALWDSSGADDPLVRRAVAGYLTACPRPAASALLAAIRRRDPGRLQQAIEAANGPLAR